VLLVEGLLCYVVGIPARLSRWVFSCRHPLGFAVEPSFKFGCRRISRETYEIEPFTCSFLETTLEVAPLHTQPQAKPGAPHAHMWQQPKQSTREITRKSEMLKQILTIQKCRRCCWEGSEVVVHRGQ
jgi:hypothetical protein